MTSILTPGGGLVPIAVIGAQAIDPGQAKSKPSTNKDGTPRANGKSQRLAAAIAKQEAELKRLGTKKAQLPECIDIQGLADYRSFQAIDNEGKNLFDFVTAAVWNARRQILSPL